MFPKQRKRRLRNSDSIRKIVSENNLTVNDLVVPVFLTEGKKVKEEIAELIEAVENNSNTVHEAADVLYHLIIYLEVNGVKIEEIMEELSARKK